MDLPFLMPIEDIFSISGRGTVVTGRIERGKVKVGENVEIVGLPRDAHDGVHGRGDVQEATGRRHGRRQRRNPACAARRRKMWSAGWCWPSRRRLRRTRTSRATVYVLSKEEGGRHTPFFKGYRPQFYFRTTDVTGVAELPEGVEMVMPGDNVELTD
jgi:elongation factor Tu